MGTTRFTTFQLELQSLPFNFFLSINHIRIKTYIQKTHVKLNVNNESDNSKKFQKFQFKKIDPKFCCTILRLYPKIAQSKGS
jgi:hypothetical protein